MDFLNIWLILKFKDFKSFKYKLKIKIKSMNK